MIKIKKITSVLFCSVLTIIFFGLSPSFAQTCTDNDGDTYAVEGGACGDVDCDDNDATVHPGAAEICDGKDTDCDGWKPPTDVDSDGDGVAACDGDCDDNDADTYPGASEICSDGKDNNCNWLTDEPGCICPDADGDGFTALYCGGTDCDDNDPDVQTNCAGCTDNDGDGVAVEGGNCGPIDCDDNDGNVHPGAAEICDGKDTDCDGWKPSTDVDADGDGVELCINDCNDNDATVYPGAAELCDGKDNNCDYIIPLNERDLDGDGYLACDAVTPDCDDNDPFTNPGQPEWCSDNKDNNCDGQTDEAGCICPDADNDGFTASFCGGTDCDDTEPAVYPGAVEECTDGLDNDCDGLLDCADPDAQNCPPITDADNDGYDIDGICGPADCDDNDPNVHPDTLEVCDGKDTNCDGWKPSTDVDQDGDGYAVCANDCDDGNPSANPGMREGNINDPSCSDGLDNDCDFAVDALDSGCMPPTCETRTSPKDPPHFFILLNPDDTVHPDNNVMNCEKCHAPDYTDAIRFACQRCHADPTDTSDPLNGTLKAQYPLDPPYGYGSAPNVKMHSSTVTGTRYGNWTMGERGCVTCHNPHAQEQNNVFGTNYGMYVKEYICFDNDETGGSVEEFVEFTSGTGAGSFADGAPNNENICEMCHTRTNYHRSDGTAAAHYDGNKCIDCHLHSNGFAHGSGGSGTGCEACHGHDAGYEYSPGQLSIGAGTSQSHSTHTENDSDDYRGPFITCSDCHDTNNFPYFKSGTDSNGDGKYEISETNVCDDCHSKGGAFDGVDDLLIGAKANWDTGIYAGSGFPAGKEDWCLSCHDEAPSSIQGVNAPNIGGDNTSYGYNVTGHGRVADYPKMSWQDASAAGNPGADLSCTDCHYSDSTHIDGIPSTTTRLKYGYENDKDNTNCNNCHKPGGMAIADPRFYTSSGDFETSAHGDNNIVNPLTSSPVLCTDCHNVHGTGGTHTAMTKAPNESLCFQCHTEGAVQNHALSNNRPGGYVSADDIQEAFGKSRKHDLGTLFTVGGKEYSLECVSCHNVHLITGKYWDANLGDKTPVTRFPPGASGNLQAWGDEPGEKMDDFAALGSGTGGWYYKTAQGYPLGSTGLPFDQPAAYRPPKSGNGYDSEFGGDVLPDYTSLCLDCHSYRVSDSIPPVNWGQGIGCTDNSVDPPNQRIECGAQHGLGIAGMPQYVSDGGTAGFWGSSGNPDVLFQMNYVTRGRHNGHFMRWPYDSADRGAGINFVMSCTDCHEAHGSDRGGMVRERLNVNANGDCGTGGDTDPNGENCTDGGNWNSFCNVCHYYYGGQHAGMSCGNASCHEANSIHRIIHTVDSGAGTQLMLTAAEYESYYEKPDFTGDIIDVHAEVDSNDLFVTFSQGVYAYSDLTGALQPGDFWLFDINNDNPRSILNVTHSPGDSTATITMSNPLTADDLSYDLLAIRPASVWNWYDGGYVNTATGTIGAQAVSAGPWPLTIPTCLTGTTNFDFNEPAGSSTATDTYGFYLGTVNNPVISIQGDGYFYGDEDQATYVEFGNDPTCLNEANTITIETRVYTSVVDLDYVDINPANGIDDDYDAGLLEDPENSCCSNNGDGRNSTQQRIFERKRAIQFTIFRGNWAGDEVAARAGKARVIVKYFVDEASRHTCPHPQWPEDTYTGNDSRWHHISTDIEAYPIVQGHWYRIKTVFNSDKSGIAGSNGTPVDIFMDDEGEDGNGLNENWTGYVNASRTINESSSCKWGALPGDFIALEDQYFHIGDNNNHNDVPGNTSNQLFKGLIDYVTWKPVADYAGVDDLPK